jgi:hypothetical protein
MHVRGHENVLNANPQGTGTSKYKEEQQAKPQDFSTLPAPRPDAVESGRHPATREDTRIDGLPQARDDVEVHLVAVNFGGHER